MFCRSDVSRDGTPGKLHRDLRRSYSSWFGQLTSKNFSRRGSRRESKMLKIENLHASVAGKEILKGLSLEVKPGQVHAVMGPNGAGKSTLGNNLAGREGYEVTAGSVSYEGRDLLELAPEVRAAAGIFLAFQYPVEIPG